MRKHLWQLQLLLITILITIIGSILRRRSNRESFVNTIGIDPSASKDENGLFNGTISVKQVRNNVVGNSKLTDAQGNVVLQPDINGNIQLQGDTSVKGNLSTNGDMSGNKITGNQLCVGDTCADPKAFKTMASTRNGRYVLADQPLVLRGDTDGNHVLQWDGRYDGPRLDGWRSGRLGTTSGGEKESLLWDGDKVTVKRQLCVDDQCMTQDDVRRFKNPVLPTPTTSVANDQTFEFGAGVQGKQRDAGKIRYGGWDSKALNIIGAGQDGQTRVTRIWDALQLRDAYITQDGDWVNISGDRNDPNMYSKGLAARSLWASDNIMVGDTIDLKGNEIKVGGSSLSSDKLCIGGVCIDKSHLEMLTGQRSLAIKRWDNDFTLGIDNGGNYFRTTNFFCGGNGCYEKLKIHKH